MRAAPWVQHPPVLTPGRRAQNWTNCRTPRSKPTRVPKEASVRRQRKQRLSFSRISRLPLSVFREAGPPISGAQAPEKHVSGKNKGRVAMTREKKGCEGGADLGTGGPHTTQPPTEAQRPRPPAHSSPGKPRSHSASGAAPSPKEQAEAAETPGPGHARNPGSKPTLKGWTAFKCAFTKTTTLSPENKSQYI